MTNGDIINYCNGLLDIQKQEKEYFDRNGKKMFGGRVKISYAISRNIFEFQNMLKAYNNVIKEITEEYRDTDKEKKVVEKEMELAKKENRDPVDQEIIMRKGKTKEEYFRKMKELQDIETDVNICTIKCDLLEELDLDSVEIGKMIFMITE